MLKQACPKRFDSRSSVQVAVALDLFGTLIPVLRHVASEISSLTGLSRDAICAAVFDTELYASLQIGGAQINDLTGVVGDVLGRSVTKEEVVALWQMEVPYVDKHAATFLQWCREEFDVVFLISDMHDVHHICADRAGWMSWFDAVVTSYEVRAMKRTGAPYSQAIQRLPGRKWCMVAVDDREENLSAASRIGLSAIHHRYDWGFATLLEALFKWKISMIERPEYLFTEHQ